jgi:hypothetical protein
MESKIDDELTYKMIGCAMKVHNTPGDGIQDVIYQRCPLVQDLNYLTAYQIEKGLLINFGATSIEVKRLFRKH